jgi:hypothetical protein
MGRLFVFKITWFKPLFLSMDKKKELDGDGLPR